jgi:hypothetical protein
VNNSKHRAASLRYAAKIVLGKASEVSIAERAKRRAKFASENEYLLQENFPIGAKTKQGQGRGNTAGGAG